MTSGSPAVSYKYDIYGKTFASNDDVNNPYQYNAEYTDSTTGLQYLRARYYNSDTHRFQTKDTYQGTTAQPITRNNYAYANNNPVNFVDPSGHFAWLVPAVKIGITALTAVSTALIANEVIDAKKDYDTGKAGIRRNISRNVSSRSPQINESFIPPNVKYGNNKVGKVFYYSNVAAVTSQKEWCEGLDELQKQTNSRIAHAGLDLAGVFVDAADFLNAGLYALEGNYDDAAIALGAGVFAVGTAVTVNKHIIKNADELFDAAGDAVKTLDTDNIPNMTKQEILDSIPDDWTYTENNGFVHIRDASGNIRVRIDPADSVTNYPHVHIYDVDGNSLDKSGNIVDRRNLDSHIPYVN